MHVAAPVARKRRRSLTRLTSPAVFARLALLVEAVVVRAAIVARPALVAHANAFCVVETTVRRAQASLERLNRLSAVGARVVVKADAFALQANAVIGAVGAFAACLFAVLALETGQANAI